MSGMDLILFFHTSMRHAWRKELNGVYRFARTRGWRVRVVEPSENPPDVAALIAFWKPVGCIVECSGKPNEYFNPDDFGDIPVVYLGRDPGSLPASASYISPSPCGPGELAAKEFLSVGLRNFAFLASGGNHFWSRDREAGFVQALRLNGYGCEVFREKLSTSGSESSPSLDGWLASLPKPCGLLAENDEAAVIAVDVAQQQKIKIPESLCVIGIDNDSKLCDNSQPKLSSIMLDFEQAGYRASEMLDHLVRLPGAEPIRETYAAICLMRRSSTPAGTGIPPRIFAALSFIREKACAGITAADVAKKIPGSRRLAEMEFRKATGRSILEEILRVRFENVEAMLKDRSLQLSVIAGFCGWRTENALRAAFLKRYGMSMRAWRARNTA